MRGSKVRLRISPRLTQRNASPASSSGNHSPGFPNDWEFCGEPLRANISEGTRLVSEMLARREMDRETATARRSRLTKDVKNTKRRNQLTVSARLRRDINLTWAGEPQIER